MKLVDMGCGAFIERLASGSPTPGGGSAAAMSGAMGAALLAMVANLTAGRDKYAAHGEFADAMLARADGLRAAFVAAVDKDAVAYGGVAAVFSMPKSTPEEKAARGQAMQSALKEAASAPLEVMGLSLDALGLAKDAIGKTNPNCAGDLGVAALSLRAALCGAWLNVLANLGGIKDEAFAAGCRERGEGTMAKALPLADCVFEEIKRHWA